MMAKEKGWKSLKPGMKVPWTEAACRALAEEWKQLLPGLAKDILAQPSYTAGSSTVAPIKDALKGAHRDDLGKSYVWLKGALLHYPCAVPGSYFLADCLVLLDTLLEKKLLPQTSNDARRSEALAAGGRIKNLIGVLRLLRRQAETSYDETIQELKSLVKFSGKGKAEKAHISSSQEWWFWSWL